MRDIMPREELCRLFGSDIAFEEYTLKEMDAIKELKPHTLFGLTMTIWNRVVDFNLYPVNPSAVEKQVERKDPETYLRISRILGTDIIRDIYYSRGAIGYDRCGTISELFAAQVYPNNLYLADIEISRPERPGGNGEYKELIHAHVGLFHKLVENAVKFGKARRCNYLLLTAKSEYQVDIFARCGFLLETPTTESRTRQYEMGTPMIRQL